MIEIIQKEDPVLRKVAEPVTKELFGSAKLKKIISDMKTAMGSQDDAVALAAPQIGVSLRIFVVAGKVFDMLDGVPEGESEHPDMVFINPVILRLSKETHQVEEGCLSVRYLYGKTVRAKKARVRAENEQGEAFELGGSGLLAQIFQHETDHLDGKLFIDIATDLEDLPPEEATDETHKGTRAIDRARAEGKSRRS